MKGKAILSTNSTAPAQPIKFLPNTTAWRNAFWIALGIFVLTRSWTLMAFPIFNDEAIYLQYSQAIKDDWPKNKYISMHGEWADWKPPLQYWMTAPVINCGRDPLLAGRAVALFTSFLGLLGFYLFAKEYFSQREAVITAMLYAVCPTVLFHNNQFTAETFLFSTTPFFYFALLKAMGPKQRWAWAILACALGTALLLFKQSGALLIALAVALPFRQLKKTESPDVRPTTDGESWAFAHWNRREFLGNCVRVAVVIAISHFAARLIIPTEFDGARNSFNARWVMSVRELLEFPIRIWQTNLRVVAEYIGSYYSWLVPFFFCAFIWSALRRKSLPDLALAFMCLAGGSAVVFLLRGFNEYLFNTAVIAVLLPLLARSGLLLWEMTRAGKAGVRAGFLVCAGIMAGYWGYQIALMSTSPGRYIERSTPWAIANYLKSWSTGFGVKEAVALLEKEKRPGILFADTQWGNPRTALEVYVRSRFPNLRIVPVSREFLDPAETGKLRDVVKKMAPVHLVIFSADTSDERAEWMANVEQQMCVTRTEIRAYPTQTPIIVCSF